MKHASPRSGYDKATKEAPFEPAVDIKDSDGNVRKEAKPVTFFSRYKEDQLLMTRSEQVQVGPKKWTTMPATVLQFRDRAFVTNDPKKIEFIRSHTDYGRKIFEFGVHNDRIKEIDDGGQLKQLDKMHRLGRMVEGLIRQGVPVG